MVFSLNFKMQFSMSVKKVNARNKAEKEKSLFGEEAF
jgi:hypothetical protein